MTVRSLFDRARQHPRGTAAVLFGALLPVLIGFMTLSIDTAVIAAARSQLSTAADASALAGAQQLANEYRVRGATDLTSTIASANAKATAFAAANTVLGRGVTVFQNPANAAGGDVLVGYMVPTIPRSPLFTDSSYQPSFNSVQVTAQRSVDHGGVVPTFFGGLMGFHGASVTVKSTATAVNYSIVGFKSKNSLSAHLLPIVLDVDTYQKMLQDDPTVSTDRYTYDPDTGAVVAGGDGVYESVLYPVKAGLPGNWGTIKVGVSNNSTSTLAAQIRYGITEKQLATFPNGVIQLDTSLSPPSITFPGNPGISAGIKDDLASIIGDPVTIPIYDKSGGQGNNAWYRVIAFAACRLLDVNFKGNPKYVIIQPALTYDPTAIAGSPQSSWTDGGLVVLHISR